MAFSCKGPSGSNQAPWSCLLTACSAPRQQLASHPPQDPPLGKGTPTPSKTTRQVPRGSRALHEHPPWGGHHFWVPLAGDFMPWGSRASGTQQCGLEGGWDPMPNRTPNTQGCRVGSHRAQVGRAWVPGRGWGPDGEGGCVCGYLPPAGHAGGALPVITASAAKLQSRAGASLPPSRPPCLSHPPPCHRSPNPPGTEPTAMAAALQPAHSHPVGQGCALSCPSGCWDPLPRAKPAPPPAMGSWGGGEGLLLLPARTYPQPLRCLPAQEGWGDPSSPHIPPGAASTPWTQLRGSGIRGPHVGSCCPWRSCKPPGTGLAPTQPPLLA